MKILYANYTQLKLLFADPRSTKGSQKCAYDDEEEKEEEEERKKKKKKNPAISSNHPIHLELLFKPF